MKFWKITILTSLLFAAAVTAIVYSSCTKDACDNVNCLNGGSCGNGICNCPTGYEGAECQILSVSRFVGIYAGDISCNNQQQVIDSAFITADNANPDYVYVTLNSILPKVLHGYVSDNTNTYSIIVTNNDSFSYDPNTLFYERLFTITLQNSNTLTIHSYEDSIFQTGSGKDTAITNCSFIGTSSN